MAINHGFHATMTAQPGKGDELVDFPLKAPSLSNDDCVGATLMAGDRGTAALAAQVLISPMLDALFPHPRLSIEARRTRNGRLARILVAAAEPARTQNAEQGAVR